MKNSTLFLLVISLSFILMVGCGVNEGPDRVDNGTFVDLKEDLEEVDQGSAPPVSVTPPVQPDLALEPFSGDFFSLDKPGGWQVFSNYQGKAHFILARDPQDPLKQIFYFSEIGPLYYSQNQKELDYQYYSLTGLLPWWFEHPVIEPFTPESFLLQFDILMESGSEMAVLIPPVNPLKNLEIITTEYLPFFEGATCALIRGLYHDEGRVSQGLFMVNMVPLFPETGLAWGGTGAAYMFTGITAPVNEFASLERPLIDSIRSFQLNDEYVDMCHREQEMMTKAIIARGKILSETSDIIMEVWNDRNRRDDITAAKRRDTILGKERLYDPSTGQVYEFNSGFYSEYNLNRNNYHMNDLQPLPEDNYDLWTRVTLGGHENLH